MCSVNGWGVQPPAPTDFSISSLMAGARSSTHALPDPRHDALLLSTYLLKLGDYPLYSLPDYHAAIASGEYRALTAVFNKHYFNLTSKGVH